MSNTRVEKPKKKYEPLKYMLNRDDETEYAEEEESELELDEESGGSSTVRNNNGS